MLTAYRQPLHKGDWVYLTEIVDGHPVGTYGKFEMYKGDVMIMHPKMGLPIRVHPDRINKLSIEEIGFRDDEFMLIEAMDDLPAFTRVHFVSGQGGDTPTCFTADGKEVLKIYNSNLMRVIVKEEDNPTVWFIQHATLSPSPLLELNQVDKLVKKTSLEIARGTFWNHPQVLRDEIKKVFIREVKAHRDYCSIQNVMWLLKDIEDHDHPKDQDNPNDPQNPVVASIIHTLQKNMTKEQVLGMCPGFTAALIENDPKLKIREAYWVWSRINEFHHYYTYGPVNKALKEVLDTIEELLPS